MSRPIFSRSHHLSVYGIFGKHFCLDLCLQLYHANQLVRPTYLSSLSLRRLQDALDLLLYQQPQLSRSSSHILLSSVWILCLPIEISGRIKFTMEATRRFLANMGLPSGDATIFPPAPNVFPMELNTA